MYADFFYSSSNFTNNLRSMSINELKALNDNLDICFYSYTSDTLCREVITKDIQFSFLTKENRKKLLNRILLSPDESFHTIELYEAHPSYFSWQEREELIETALASPPSTYSLLLEYPDFLSKEEQSKYIKKLFCNFQIFQNILSNLCNFNYNIVETCFEFMKEKRYIYGLYSFLENTFANEHEQNNFFPYDELRKKCFSLLYELDKKDFQKFIVEKITCTNLLLYSNYNLAIHSHESEYLSKLCSLQNLLAYAGAEKRIRILTFFHKHIDSKDFVKCIDSTKLKPDFFNNVEKLFELVQNKLTDEAKERFNSYKMILKLS